MTQGREWSSSGWVARRRVRGGRRDRASEVGDVTIAGTTCSRTPGSMNGRVVVSRARAPSVPERASFSRGLTLANSSSASSPSSPPRAAVHAGWMVRPSSGECATPSTAASRGHEHRGQVRRGARLARRRDHVRARTGADHVPRGRIRPVGLVWSYLFVACAVLRLARFNVEQPGPRRRLPGSPSRRRGSRWPPTTGSARPRSTPKRTLPTCHGTGHSGWSWGRSAS